MENRNIILAVLILFIYAVGFSQSKNTFDIETQGGYEYNYFKSPKEVRVNDSVLSKEDLISSSIYQDISINYKYRYKWKKNRIRLSLNPFSRLFYENFDDSYWSLDTRAKYDHRFTKKTIFLTEVRFRRMNREGLGGDQDVLINPLGYTNYGATAGIKLMPFNANEMTLEGFYNFKNFDAFGVRDLQFDEFGVQFSSVQSFTVNRLEHKLGVNTYFKKRKYDTFNASEIDTDGERDWDYIKGGLFYELPFSEKFKIKPNFVYYTRIDNSTGRSGFNQFGPGINMRYKNKTTKVRTSLSFITRKYKEIEARNTEMAIGENLKYQYANFNLNASHKIGNGFSLIATLYSRVRSTNYTDIDARSFRNYRNQYAGIGVLWEL
ncbi:hypothetical protein [Aquimarina megaterium]|uniref:hypothetical protein n=1 Tax=Aquimarina megaterium TaxID=1443666 RepID=UPI0004707F55|nr:hypothetical protein [Aquimarina megaterium]